MVKKRGDKGKSVKNKKVPNEFKFLKAFSSFVMLSLVVVGVSSYFLHNAEKIGFAFIFLGLISLLIIRIAKIEFRAVYPDMIFGMIDNGILIFAAVLGGNLGGVTGAVIGGAAGNTITDGIGGLFEGHIAEHQRDFKIDNMRTALSTSLGKMTGCLFGAGAGLIVVWLISLL